MEFEWDPAKNTRCRMERGFAFSDILPAFVDPNRLVVRDVRFDYGENRYQLFGQVRGGLHVIVYTHRGSAIRIIPARKANHREQQRYDARPT